MYKKAGKNSHRLGKVGTQRANQRKADGQKKRRPYAGGKGMLGPGGDVVISRKPDGTETRKRLRRRTESRDST